MPTAVGTGHRTVHDIEDHVIEVVGGVFRTGLEQSLVVTGIGMFIAAVITARTGSSFGG